MKTKTDIEKSLIRKVGKQKITWLSILSFTFLLHFYTPLQEIFCDVDNSKNLENHVSFSLAILGWLAYYLDNFNPTKNVYASLFSLLPFSLIMWLCLNYQNYFKPVGLKSMDRFDD